MEYINPVASAAAAFLQIWNALPLAYRELFYVVLALLILWAFYSLFVG